MQKSALVETDLNADNITVPNDLFNSETSHEGLAIENIEQCKLLVTQREITSLAVNDSQ